MSISLKCYLFKKWIILRKFVVFYFQIWSTPAYYNPLRSSEAFLDCGGSLHVKPETFDSWSIGILILELLKNSYLTNKLTMNVCIWTKEAYSVIQDVLKVRWSYYFELISPHYEVNLHNVEFIYKSIELTKQIVEIYEIKFKKLHHVPIK